MKNPHSIAAGLILVSGLWTSAQNLRCDLVTPIVDGLPTCVDADSLDGRTFRVPSNTTRISESGIVLCPPATRQTLSADIVYVIDQSRSMVAWAFHVDSTGDTAWYHDRSADVCGSWMAQNDGGTDNAVIEWPRVGLRTRHYTYPSVGARLDQVIRIPTSIARGRISSDCRPAGDPYSWRAEAVRAAIRHQASTDSTSQAGTIGFHSDVTIRAGLRPLDAAGTRRLLDSTGLHSSGGTFWAPPLDTALRWLRNMPSDRPQAIIFVSDGVDGNPNSYQYLFNDPEHLPPIYGIYLGSATDDIGQLRNITSVTGGHTWVIPPDDPDSLSAVIQEVVSSVTITQHPRTATLLNSTLGQQAITETVIASGNAWRLGLDSVTGLALGNNQMSLVTTWTTPQGERRSDTADFVLQVDLPASGSGPVVHTPFGTLCGPGSMLSILDAQGRTRAELGADDVAIRVRLTPSVTPPLPTRLTLNARSDSEIVVLRVGDEDGPVSWLREVPLRPGNVLAGRPGDGLASTSTGRDTLRARWCFPRDARDCAEAMQPVNVLGGGHLRWVQDAVDGPRGEVRLEATAPGHRPDTLRVQVLRMGRDTVSLILNRETAELFAGTARFIQSLRLPSGDTVWMGSPNLVGGDDLLVARTVRGTPQAEWRDTLVVRRPPVELTLRRTFAPDSVLIGLVGGEPDAQRRRRVALWGPGTDTLWFDLGTRNEASVDVAILILLAQHGASVRLDARFVDPVYRDTVQAMLMMPPLRTNLRWVQDAVDGPRGEVGLEATAPGHRPDTLRVQVLRPGRDTVSMLLNREAADVFTGSARFIQSLRLPSGDTVWMGSPDLVGGDDFLVARIVRGAAQMEPRDTLLVRRPPVELTLRRTFAPDSVLIGLVGGEPDAQRRRRVALWGPGTDTLWFDPGTRGEASVDVAILLEAQSGASVRLEGRFVDPVYRDTVQAGLLMPIPLRTLVFVPNRMAGPIGSFLLAAEDPLAQADLLTATLEHGSRSWSVVLSRVPGTSRFERNLAFSQGFASSGDTLALGAPLVPGGPDSLLASLASRGAAAELHARAVIVRPPLRLLATGGQDAGRLQVLLEGAQPDFRGEARVRLSAGDRGFPDLRPAPGTLMATWDGQMDLSDLLPESRSPVVVTAWFVDPVYGDTARDTARVVSPWTAATLTVSPNTLDPRRGDTAVLVVRDRDPDPLRVGSVTVQGLSGSWWVLHETGPATGEYRLAVPASSLDPAWAQRPPRRSWSRSLRHVDPDHPEDVTEAIVHLEFDVPPPRLERVGSLAPKVTHPAAPGTSLVLRTEMVGDSEGARGVRITTWERLRVRIWVYDHLGVVVSGLDGDLPSPTGDRADGIVRMAVWDGRDAQGEPAKAGVYLMRVVAWGEDGQMISNEIHRFGVH